MEGLKMPEEEAKSWLEERRLREVDSLIKDIGFAITQTPNDKDLIDKLNEALRLRAQLRREKYPGRNTTF